jgi:Ca-activated chloride channel family protein
MADYVEPKEDLEVKVSNFFTKVNYPVLTNLKLDMGGAQTDLIYPRGIPDLFRGSQVTLIGRYTGEANLESVRLTLTGQSGGSTRTYHYDNLAFPRRTENNDYLPRLWATRRGGWLMEQVRSNGEQKELRDEIVDLGTRYGIVTPYTSYLATENLTSLNVVATSPTQLRTDGRGFTGGLRPAKESKDTFSNAPTTGAVSAAANAPPAVTLSTGEAAVQQSKRARVQQEADKLVEFETRRDAVKRAEGKTFYLIDGVWTDSEFKADAKLSETTLTFGSDEYFALLKQQPKLASFFSLGERVVVVFEGRVYRVNAAAP